LALLRCYTTLDYNCIPTFQDSYESHLQQHSSPESSIRDHKCTLLNIAEDLRHQLQRKLGMSYKDLCSNPLANERDNTTYQEYIYIYIYEAK